MKREEYIPDEAVVKRANAAVKIELEKKKALDIPIVVYDRQTQTIYHDPYQLLTFPAFPELIVLCVIRDFDP